MTDLSVIILIVLSIINLYFLFTQSKNKQTDQTIDPELYLKLSNFIQQNSNNQFKQLLDLIDKNQKSNETQLNSIRKTVDLQFQSTINERFNQLFNQVSTILKDNHTSSINQLNSLEKRFSTNIENLNNLQKTNFLQLIQSTEKQLDQMRQTVDEKLHKTLETRLGESFKFVSDRLELVHKGIGEMQTLAVGVGDLKRVLTNVKTRGILGEIQLEQLLEQVFTPNQYEKNVAVKDRTQERVDFALKIPSEENEKGYILLPIDSKFSLDPYNNLILAYDNNDEKQIKESMKAFESAIKTQAKSISQKYINVPRTTDFAILFVPIEGIYAEIARQSNLIDTLYRDYKITIAGPTTLSVLLSSFNMGFKTIVMQKHSTEVWNVLGEVKTEFENFSKVLKSAQDKINSANNEIETLVGVRSRALNKKLGNIDKLSSFDEISK